MRNKNRHASPFRWMLRQYFFLAVLVFVITFAVFPMQGMMRVLSTGQMMKNMTAPMERSSVNYYTRELTLSFVYSPLNLETLCLLFGGMGFGAAVVLFRHLFSRKQVMMNAGLPVTRERDFALRGAVYAVCCLLPMAVCLVIHPLMVRVNRLEALFDPQSYWIRAGVTLLINLFGFVTGALCASVFGTIWSATLGGLLLGGSVELVLYCWITMAGWYLNTLFVNGTVKGVMRFSPVYSLYKAFYQPGQYGVLPGVLAILLYGALALAAYRRALPENAGHTLNLKRLEPWILGWATALGGTLGAVVLSLYLGREFTLYLGLLLGAAIVWLMTRMLLDQRIRLSLKKGLIPAAVTAGMLVLFLVLRAGWFGFDGWAPAKDRVAAVLVRPGNDSRREMRFEDPESRAAALEWVDQMREETLEMRRETPYRGAEYADLFVTFRDQNGGTVTRQYRNPENRIPVLSAMRVMAESYAKQQAGEMSRLPKVSCYSAMTSFGLYGAEFKEAYGFSMDSVSQTRLKADEVREALRLDLEARTLETLQQPTILRIWFDGTDPETGEYAYDEDAFSVRPGDVHTLQLILGEDAEKWAEYAMGGFAANDDIKVFRCDCAEEDDMQKVVSWEMAETPEKAKEWMRQVTCCAEDCFRWPEDSDHLLMVYSLVNLRNLAEDGEIEIDLDDPEAIRNLPGAENIWGNSYLFMAAQE